MESSYQPNMVSPQQYKQYAYNPEANIPHWQHASYMYPDPTSTGGSVMLHAGPYNPQSDINGPYNAQSLEQLANEVLDSRYVNDGDYTVPQPNGDSLLHPALQQQNSVSSQSAGHREDISPLLAKSHPNLHVTNGLDQTNQPFPANETDDRPSSSGGPVQPHNTDSSGTHLQDGHGATMNTSSVVAAVENGQSSIAPVQPAAETVAPPLDTSLTHVKDVNPSSEEPAASLAVASITGLASIPLYQPPAPPLTKSQTPRIKRHSFEVSTERPASRVQRSLSKTPVPTQATQTTELKTPGSTKRKRDSLSATPGTAKSKKLEHIIREKSILEEEEEQSMQLARELQDQDWGLRRRSRC